MIEPLITTETLCALGGDHLLVNPWLPAWSQIDMVGRQDGSSEASVTQEPQLFTVDEANALIPRLELIMERMQRRGIELRQAIEAMARETDEPMLNVEVSQLLERRPELQALVEELEHCIAEIEECGAQFKGLELGLVDFLAEIDGQIGLLCWQYGEKEITHWHPLNVGFDGRQPLPSVSGRSFLQ